MNALILLIGLLFDRLFGEPAAIWSRVPHPVVAIGGFIDTMDRYLNPANSSSSEAAHSSARQKGILVVLILIAASIILGLVIEGIAAHLPFGFLIEIAIVFALLAHRSLLDHVGDVETALREEGLAKARETVARIVGRDVERLDESGISRAAIESLAENFSDGVLAPAFWFLLLGLPGLILYKAINTADSMIGHKTDRYREFGWASARFDDLMNWVPARLCAGVLLIAGSTSLDTFKSNWKRVTKDAPTHRSPNAGWPEAAIAMVIGVALGGPRTYGDHVVDGVWLNKEGRQTADPDDINAALNIVRRTWVIVLIMLALIVLACWQ